MRLGPIGSSCLCVHCKKFWKIPAGSRRRPDANRELRLYPCRISSYRLMCQSSHRGGRRPTVQYGKHQPHYFKLIFMHFHHRAPKRLPLCIGPTSILSLAKSVLYWLVREPEKGGPTPAKRLIRAFKTDHGDKPDKRPFQARFEIGVFTTDSPLFCRRTLQSD